MSDDSTKSILMTELYRLLEVEKRRLIEDRTSAAAISRKDLLEDLVEWSQEML